MEVGGKETLSPPESSRPASRLLFSGHRGSIPESKAAGCVNLPIHIHRVLRLRKNGATTLLPIYAFTAWTG